MRADGVEATLAVEAGGGLGWVGIARLGVAQFALGAMVVLATSTLNRIMVVELALPALLPGGLIGLHYILQIARPGFGHAADAHAGHTGRGRWIMGGMLLLAMGVVAAAGATMLMAHALVAGIVVAVVAYGAIGLGVGASGTALLTVLACLVAPGRRAAAATVAWIMMIAGSAVTATVVGLWLRPFSLARLVAVVAVAAGVACVLTVAAVWGIEPAGGPGWVPPRVVRPVGRSPVAGLAAAMRALWAEQRSRRFAVFVFVSMLAYSGQELILEPFAGLVFGLAPGVSTRLIGLQHGGVMGGMLLVAVAGSVLGRVRAGSGRSERAGMRVWAVLGCAGSALALLALAGCGLSGATRWLAPCIVALGGANGVFAVSAIGAMMQLAAEHGAENAGAGPGASMGLFGAAQAVAFGTGGLLSSGASDVGRHLLGSPLRAYGCVFVVQAGLFAVAGVLAMSVLAVGAAAPARMSVGWIGGRVGGGVGRAGVRPLTVEGAR